MPTVDAGKGQGSLGSHTCRERSSVGLDEATPKLEEACVALILGSGEVQFGIGLLVGPRAYIRLLEHVCDCSLDGELGILGRLDAGEQNLRAYAEI